VAQPNFDRCGQPEPSGIFLGFDTREVRIPVYSRPVNMDLRTLQKPQMSWDRPPS
jgi:hypothetical protein